MKNYPAMEIIRSQVDEKYHKYIIKSKITDGGITKTFYNLNLLCDPIKLLIF
jgi:hypothetical protein